MENRTDDKLRLKLDDGRRFNVYGAYHLTPNDRRMLKFMLSQPGTGTISAHTRHKEGRITPDTSGRYTFELIGRRWRDWGGQVRRDVTSGTLELVS